MDEISKNIRKENIGIQIEGFENKISSLLWVDDVANITTNSKELQKTLDITYETSNIYHVEYGKSKSNTQIIKTQKRKRKDQTKEELKLGDIPLEMTDKYKYLGYIQNTKNNNEDHIKIIKGKTEAEYQKMMALTGNSNFSMIEMETIWKVVEACITPIITYAGEIMEMNQANFKPANKILDGILKRILKVPVTTPREALYIETGLLDVEAIIKKNRISMEHRIINGNNQMIKQLLKLTCKDSWAEQNKILKVKLNIQENDMISSKYQLRNTLQSQIRKSMEERLKTTAETKSKMQYYIDGKNKWKVGQRSKYLTKLTRNQASTIFKSRTRMLKVKSNYKNGHNDLTCRLCGEEEETQKHILEECSLLSMETASITEEMIFKEEITELQKTAKMIETRMKKLEETNPKSTSLSLTNASVSGECAH